MIAKTSELVIINHSDRLHERITDRRPDKLETASRKIAAQQIRLRRESRYARAAFTFDRLSTDESPHISVETAKLFLNFQKGSGVLNCGVDLQTIGNDAD